MLLGVGLGVAAAGGVAAWLLARDEHAPNTAASGIPAGADGPGNLAVAWWPQDISLDQRGADATLRFQSTVANLGGEPVDLRAGDRVEYTLYRTGTPDGPGVPVGRSVAPLELGAVESFPVRIGVDIGRPISDVGVTLEKIAALAPQTAAVVGAGHASQAITIRDARAGHYELHQEIVRADGATDHSSFDDVRITEFELDGAGGYIHLGSQYAG